MSSTAPQTRPGGTPLPYMPQLDGLRAVAVVGIWFEHWGIASQPGFHWLEWGRLAVWLFFVLSGFLITGILLKSKESVDTGEQPVSRAAMIFYLRRFLRILPIYYITLFAMALVLPEVRRLFFWHLTYTTDFFVTRHPNDLPVGIHFWTLAVEEQFYLVWPWLVLLLPSRLLSKVLWMMVGGALAYRAAFYGLCISHQSFAALGLPIVGNIDKFALGGLLATSRMHSGDGAVDERRLRQWSLWLGLPLLLALEVLHRYRPESRPGLVLTSTAAGLFFTWVLAGASVGFRGPIGKLLAWRPVTFTGKISYGIYLFHMFVPRLLRQLHVPLPLGLWAKFFIYAAVTVLAAAISWYLIESPINSLKRWFRYTSPQTSTEPAMSDTGKRWD